MVNTTLSKEMLEHIQRTLTGIDYNLCIKKRYNDTENFEKYDILYLKPVNGQWPYFVKLATLKKGGTFLHRINYRRADLNHAQVDALESFLEILNFK